MQQYSAVRPLYARVLDSFNHIKFLNRSEGLEGMVAHTRENHPKSISDYVGSFRLAIAAAGIAILVGCSGGYTPPVITPTNAPSSTAAATFMPEPAETPIPVPPTPGPAEIKAWLEEALVLAWESETSKSEEAGIRSRELRRMVVGAVDNNDYNVESLNALHLTCDGWALGVTLGPDTKTPYDDTSNTGTFYGDIIEDNKGGAEYFAEKIAEGSLSHWDRLRTREFMKRELRVVCFGHQEGWQWPK